MNMAAAKVEVATTTQAKVEADADVHMSAPTYSREGGVGADLSAAVDSSISAKYEYQYTNP